MPVRPRLQVWTFGVPSRASLLVYASTGNQQVGPLVAALLAEQKGADRSRELLRLATSNQMIASAHRRARIRSERKSMVLAALLAQREPSSARS